MINDHIAELEKAHVLRSAAEKCAGLPFYVMRWDKVAFTREQLTMCALLRRNEAVCRILRRDGWGDVNFFCRQVDSAKRVTDTRAYNIYQKYTSIMRTHLSFIAKTRLPEQGADTAQLRCNKRKFDAT